VQFLQSSILMGGALFDRKLSILHSRTGNPKRRVFY
jgi:hypothetical protein